MPGLTDHLFEIDARVVGVFRGVEGGIVGREKSVVAPELVERGVEEDVAVCGVGDEEVEGGVTGADDGDGAGDDG